MFVELSKAKREHGLYFWPFGADLRLAEVILGPPCEVPLASVRELTDATNVQAVVFKARLTFRSFRVVHEVNMCLRTTKEASLSKFIDDSYG